MNHFTLLAAGVAALTLSAQASDVDSLLANDPTVASATRRAQIATLDVQAAKLTALISQRLGYAEEGLTANPAKRGTIFHKKTPGQGPGVE